MMDLNLLPVLDALLQESSVSRAAERLGTSPAATSRMLARLRRLVGDPLLVRAGQGLVPTPRALELRDEVAALVRRTDALLRPGSGFDPAGLRRSFAVQAAEVLLAGLAGPLLARVRAEAPGVDVVFRPETLEGGDALRQGLVDVELGVLGHLDPETRHRPLTALPMLGAARRDHPLFAGPIDAARFAAADHIGVSRQGRRAGPIDRALEPLGLRRRVPVVVPSHPAALLLAARSDLVTLTAAGWLPDVIATLGLRTFPIPLPLPGLDIGLAWHPRNDTDPAHRWFRAHLAAALPRPDVSPVHEP